MRYDTVVIGSGASGLGAALALARHGQRVALVERHEHLAPLLRRFKRDGWWCDPGLHHVGGLHPGGPLSVIFRYLGVHDLIRPVPLNPDGYDIVDVVGGKPLRLPVGLDRVWEALIEYFPGSRRAVTAYLEEVEAIHRRTPFLNFDLPGEALAAKEDPASFQSVADFLGEHGADPSLQKLFSRYGYYLYGMEGHECPLNINAMVLGSFFFSAHTLARGGDEIVAAFERKLEEAGVDVFCRRPVVGLEIDSHRRLRGVRLAGDEVLECRASVCTIHPHLLPNLLPSPAVRPAFLTRIGSLGNTFGPLAVFLAADDPPEELCRSNIYFVSGGSPAISNSHTLVALNPAGADAVAGRRSLCLMRVCPPTLCPPGQCGKHRRRAAAYEERKQEETERTVEMLLHHFPAQRGKCRVLDAATPGTYESYTGTAAGSAYGIKHSILQSALGSKTPIKGLYLAGQSVLAPGLLGVMISSLLAVSHIIGPQTVWDELRQWR